MTSAALLSHLAGPVLTVATLVTITRRDGAAFGFTDHDQPIIYGGRSYLPGTYTPSAIVSTSDAAVDNLEITGLIDGAIITRADLLAGVWRGARVVVEQINYRDLTQGSRVLRTGLIGEVALGETSFRAELRGLAQMLQQPVGELSTVRCRADLGDARCGVDVAALTVSGAVTWADADARTFEDTARTEPGPAGAVAITGITTAQYAAVTATAHGRSVGQVVMLSGISGMRAQTWINGRAVTGEASINGSFATVRSVTNANTLVLNLDTRNYSAYAGGGQLQQPGNVGTFDGGKILWTSGANAGRSMDIKAYSPGLIVLQSAMPYPIAVGDTYTAAPGCGKRALEDCAARYGNIIRFRGEPHRPGIDQLMKAAGS